MSEFVFINGHEDKPHTGINSFGAAYSVSRGKAIEPAELRQIAYDLMKAVSDECLKLGAIDIGHIKASVEHATGFLYADTVGDASLIEVAGRDGEAVKSFSITINSVICGLSAEAVKDATEDAIGKVFLQYGLSADPVEHGE